MASSVSSSSPGFLGLCSPNEPVLFASRSPKALALVIRDDSTSGFDRNAFLRFREDGLKARLPGLLIVPAWKVVLAFLYGPHTTGSDLIDAVAELCLPYEFLAYIRPCGEPMTWNGKVDAYDGFDGLWSASIIPGRDSTMVVFIRPLTHIRVCKRLSMQVEPLSIHGNHITHSSRLPLLIYRLSMISNRKSSE